MAYRIKESRAATDDIGNVLEYISESLHNAAAAADLLDELSSCYDQLADNPFVFQDGDGMFVPKGIRRAIIGRYLLFYMIDEANSVVHIVRFLYGAMRYEDLLQ